MKKIQKNKKVNSGGYRYGCSHCFFKTDNQWEMFCHAWQNHGFKGVDIMGYD